MTTPSFAKLATTSASTKRNPAISGGKIGAPVANLTGLSIVPLAPVSGEYVEKYKLESPRRSYVTYIEGSQDISVKDLLTISGSDYEILAVSPFTDPFLYQEILVEEIDE